MIPKAFSCAIHADSKACKMFFIGANIWRIRTKILKLVRCNNVSSDKAFPTFDQKNMV